MFTLLKLAYGFNGNGFQWCQTIALVKQSIDNEPSVRSKQATSPTLSIHTSQDLLNFVQIRFVKDVTWISPSCFRWICQNCYMDFSKLLHGYVKVVVCVSCPLRNKTKLKFEQDFKACWSFCFELKVLNESNYSMPWVCCAIANDFYNSQIWPDTFECVFVKSTDQGLTAWV